MKPNTFLRTTLLGGLAAILPLALLVLIVRWIINLIEKYLKPIVSLIEPQGQLATISTYVILVIAILAIFFFIGLFVKTRFGNIVRNHLEQKYLMKIPGYKTMKDVVMQFAGGKRSFLSEVVLVDIFGNGTLMTGFIVDETKEYATIFVPTGPNPTSGNIFHVKHECIIRSSAPVEAAIKSIISVGAGSSEIINAAKFPESNNEQAKDTGGGQKDS